MKLSAAKKIAYELKKAQDENFLIPPLSDRFPNFSIDNAYNVLNELHKIRLEEGHLSFGRKIGFTNSFMWERYSVKEPIWSYMYDNTIEYVNQKEHICNLSSFSQGKIEPGIVIHFSKTPVKNTSLEELIECINWIAFAYEIVQCHYPKWKFNTSDVVADFALHGKLIIGKKIDIKELSNPIDDLKNFTLELYCDKEKVETGYGYNALNSPLLAVLYLIEVLLAQNLPLKAGEIVTIGTITKAFTLEEGQVWTSKISGINLETFSVKVET